MDFVVGVQLPEIIYFNYLYVGKYIEFFDHISGDKYIVGTSRKVAPRLYLMKCKKN